MLGVGSCSACLYLGSFGCGCVSRASIQTQLTRPARAEQQLAVAAMLGEAAELHSCLQLGSVGCGSAGRASTQTQSGCWLPLRNRQQLLPCLVVAAGLHDAGIWRSQAEDMAAASSEAHWLP